MRLAILDPYSDDSVKRYLRTIRNMGLLISTTNLAVPTTLSLQRCIQNMRSNGNEIDTL